MSFHKHQNLAVKAIPILSLIVVFAALVFFGLSRINRALAVTIPGFWLQTTDSATASDGFNLPGNTKTQTGVRGTGTGAGVGLGINSSSIMGANWQIFGSNGTGLNQFIDPQRVAVDTINNKVFVTDFNGFRVARFDSGSGGTTLGANWQTFGSSGSGVNQFSGLVGVAVDPINNKVYVTDTNNNRVISFDSGSGGTTLGASWQVFNSGPIGQGDIAVDSANNKVYMADSANNRVVRFDSGSGGTIFGANSQTFGSSGSGVNQFSGLVGVTVDSANNKVYVSDTGNGRVISFDSGSGGTTLGASWQTAGSLSNPMGINVDAANNSVYVADFSNYRVVRFDSGSGGTIFGANSQTFGSSGSGQNQFTNPRGVAVDGANLKIYTADTGNSRIAKFDAGNFSASGSFISAPLDTAQNSTFTNLTFSSTVPTNYNQWTQTTNADFGAGTNSATTVSGGSVMLLPNIATTTAALGFSSTQGANNWYYKEHQRTGANPTWDETRLANMTWDGVNNYWKGSYTYNLIWNVGQHPDNYESVRQWTAPTTGNIRITGTVSDSDLGGGDGIIARVMYNTTQLWTATIPNNGAASSFDITRYVTIGDRIYFRVNMNGNSLFDSTFSDPLIQYPNPAGYYTSGTYTSPVKQLPPNHTLGNMSWAPASQPANTSLAMWARTCTQADCSDRGATVINPSAGNWSQATVNGASIASMGYTNDTDGYIQYKAEMTSDGTATPSLDSVAIGVDYSPMKIDIQSSPDGSSWTSENGPGNWQTAYAAPTSGATNQTNTSMSISTLPQNQWVRYRVSLATLNNGASPMMEEIRIGYISYTNFNFSVTASPSEGEVSSGGSIVIDQPGVTAANTFGTAPNPVAFSADTANLPKGVSVEFSAVTPSDPCTPDSCVVVPTFYTNVSSCTGSSTLFCPTTMGTTPIDTFVIPIRASIVADIEGNILTKETTFMLTVTEPFNYSMTWANTAPCSGGTNCSGSVKQGENISADLSALQTSIGQTESVSYSYTASAQGVSVLFSPGNCYPSPSCSTTATVRTTFTGGAGDTPTGGPYVITIIGTTAGGLQRSITFNSTVTAGFNFSLSWDSDSVTTLKSGSISSGDTTILNAALYAKYVGGPAGSVSFSIAPYDPGIIINPGSILPNSFTAIGETYSVPIEIFAPSISVTQQTTYIITITGTSNGNMQKSVNYSLTIYPPFDFDLKFTPDTGNFNSALTPQDTSSGTVYQGDSLTANFIVGYNSQITRVINLSAAVSPANSGVGASLSKSSCADYTDCLLIMLSVNAQNPATGNFTITVTGDAGSGITHTATYTLTVVIPPFDYNIAGWAWSDGVGWISFNSQNCDTNWNGQIDDDDFTDGGANPHEIPPPACQPLDSSGNPITLPVSAPNYGVYLDLSTYALSGYAWSEHIGWITFEKSIAGAPPASPYNGGESYIAKMDANDGTIKGWARAVSCPDTECGTGWGWIKLSGTSSDNSIYNVSKAGADEFSGFAWGDKTLGWISFSSKNCDDDNGLLASAASTGFINCGGNGFAPFPAHDSVTHPDEYRVWFKGQLPNSPPSCDNIAVRFDDICGAPFEPKVICKYNDKESDPLAQYTIKVYDENSNELIFEKTFAAWGGSLQNGAYLSAGGDLEYKLNPSDNQSGSGASLNYNGNYRFVVTVQDEYHLE